MKTAPASGTRSTSSRFSRIRRSSRLCRSVRSRPTSRAIAATTIASCERWSTRPRAARIGIFSCATAAATTAGGWRRYQIDMNTCLPKAHSEPTDYSIQTHEFFLWHDPANTNRVIAYVTNWTGGVPGCGTSRPEDAGRPRHGDDRREHGRDAAEGEVPGRLQSAGRRRPADQREAGRDRPVFRRPLSRFQRAEESLRTAAAISRTRSRTACIRCRSATMASGCTWRERRRGSTS